MTQLIFKNKSIGWKMWYLGLFPLSIMSGCHIDAESNTAELRCTAETIIFYTINQERLETVRAQS